MDAAWRSGWKSRAGASWAKLWHWLRPRVTTRADLVQYRVGLRRRPKLRAVNAGEMPRFFFSSGTVAALCGLWRKLLPLEAAAAIEQAEQICRHRFDLLGFENVSVGSDVDWHYDAVHGARVPRKPWFRLLHTGRTGGPARADRNIIWALNRHQHLVTLAKVYRLTGNGKYATEVFCQWRHWHALNPYPMGVNWVSSREVAWRSLSWCWLYFLLAESPQLPPGFRADWLQAMNVSGRHLERYALEYAAPGAQKLAEGVALFFTGVLCPELEAAERWKARGWEIVLHEVQAQMIPAISGEPEEIRFDHSVSEHVHRLDFFLHACILASVNQVEVPGEMEALLEKMLEAVSLLGRAGTPPRLGGNDGGRVFDARRNRPEHMLDPLATGAILFGRGDFKQVAGDFREESLWLLGEQGAVQFHQLHAQSPPEGAAALPEAGIYLMANAGREQQLVIDARPETAGQARQGHALALSVSVNHRGRELLIDPGMVDEPSLDSAAAESSAASAVSEAGTLEFPKLSLGRSYPLSVRNTVLVHGGRISPQPGEKARVHAERWIKGRNFDLFVGSHDGYGTRERPVTHRRWVFGLQSEFWLVRDMVVGEGRYGLGLFWHISPALTRYDAKTGMFAEVARGTGLRVLPAEGHGWSQDIRQSSWSPVYGSRDPLHVLRFSTMVTLPEEFATLLAPVNEREATEGRLAQIRHTPKRGLVTGYRYDIAAEAHCMFFGQGGSWSLGLWSSDAEFLYWNPVGDRRVLICCNGTFVEAGGQRVFSSAKPVERCEIVIAGEQMGVFSSAPDLEVSRQALDVMLPAIEPVPVARPRSAKRAAGGR